MEPSEYLAAAYHAAQRELDNIPCSKCGGDVLRADFVSPDRCHVAMSKR